MSKPAGTGADAAGEGSSERETIRGGPEGVPTFPLEPGAGEGTLPRPFGRYILEREVGRGGMGVVYRALDPALGRPVAIKVLSGGGFADSEAVERFGGEARAVAALAHPGIVPLYEAGETEGVRYLAMEFVEGTSLDRRARGGPLPPAEAVRIVRDAAQALQFAHGKGIIHRDVKPSNLRVDESGRVRILDFGLAKRVGAERGITLAGDVVGTPAYMAPEQVTGDAARIGPRTDVYGLGAVLYELITGRPPFSGQTAIEVLFKVRDADPVPPRRVNPRVHRDIETICLKAMEKRPERRYGSAGALAEDITRFLEGEPVTARGLTAATRLRRFVWRNRLNVTAAASAALAAVAVLALTFARTREFWDVLKADPLRKRGGEWTVLLGGPEWTSEGLRMSAGRGGKVRLDDLPLRRGAAVEVTVRAPDPSALGEISVALLSERFDPLAGPLGYQLLFGSWGNTRTILQRGTGGEFLGEASVRLEPGRDYRLRLEQVETSVFGYVDGKKILEHQEIFVSPEGSRGFRVYLSVYGGKAIFRDLRVERRRGFRRDRPMEEADGYAFEGDSGSAREVYRQIAAEESRPRDRDLAALKAILCRLPWWERGRGSRDSAGAPPAALLVEVLGELDGFLAARPDSGFARAARFERAHVLAWQGKREDAEREIRSLRAGTGPGDPIGYALERFHPALAERLLSAGRNEEAIQCYEDAIREAAGDPTVQTSLRKQLGRAWLYTGDPGKAEAVFAEAMRGSPDPGEVCRIRLERIEALLALRRLDEARALCDEALKDPIADREGTLAQARLDDIRIDRVRGQRAETLGFEARARGKRAEAERLGEEARRIQADVLERARRESGLRDPRDLPKQKNFRVCILRAELEAEADRIADAVQILESLDRVADTEGPFVWMAMEGMAARIRISQGTFVPVDDVDEAARLARRLREVPGTFRAGWFLKSEVPAALLLAAGNAEDARKAEILETIILRFPYMRKARDEARRSLDALVRDLMENGLAQYTESDRVPAEAQFRAALKALGAAAEGQEEPGPALLRGDLYALLGEAEKAREAYGRGAVRDRPADPAALVLRLRRGEIDEEGLRKGWPQEPDRDRELPFELGESLFLRALALPGGPSAERKGLLGEARARFQECVREEPAEDPGKKAELARLQAEYLEAKNNGNVVEKQKKLQAYLAAIQGPPRDSFSDRAENRLGLIDEILPLNAP